MNSKEYTIGSQQSVTLSNQNICVGTILDKRFIESLNKTQYYIHFNGKDRRLDNWIDSTYIHSSSDVLHSFKAKNEAFPSESAPHLTRLQKRKFSNEEKDSSEVFNVQPLKKCSETQKECKMPIKVIECIQFAKFEISCWYPSPYPEEFGQSKKLFICQFCLKYMRFLSQYKLHVNSCSYRQPPGIEIYRKGQLSVYQIDGVEETLYCQNLSLLAKLFLEHKAVYYDVDPFLFFVLTYVDKNGAHILGYFSKEKENTTNNLACILVLPPFQKFGFGTFLIALSYEVSRRKGFIGSPEKPLSDLGLASYRSFWRFVILNTIKQHSETITIKKLCEISKIAEEDILYTLKSLNIVKYWKGEYTLSVTNKQITYFLQKYQNPKIILDTSRLIF